MRTSSHQDKFSYGDDKAYHIILRDMKDLKPTYTVQLLNHHFAHAHVCLQGTVVVKTSLTETKSRRRQDRDFVGSKDQDQTARQECFQLRCLVFALLYLLNETFISKSSEAHSGHNPFQTPSKDQEQTTIINFLVRPGAQSCVVRI